MVHSSNNLRLYSSKARSRKSGEACWDCQSLIVIKVSNPNFIVYSWNWWKIYIWSRNITIQSAEADDKRRETL